jgi:DNA-binding MarR family transcriptional regulator
MPEDTTEAKNFDLEAFLPYRLSLLSNTISEGIAIAYRDVHGLSLTEWRVIAILGRFPDLTATDVMARGAMDKVAVSRAVNRLDERGYIRRTALADDRRRVALRLTRQGVRLFNAVVPQAQAYERELLSALTTGERAQLEALLDKLMATAHALGARPQE